MNSIDPKTLRFLALLSAPLFTLIAKYTRVEVPLEIQEMLVGTVAIYLLGSHGKEALVRVAEAKAAAASSVVTPADAAKVLADPEAKP